MTFLPHKPLRKVRQAALKTVLGEFIALVSILEETYPEVILWDGKIFIIDKVTVNASGPQSYFEADGVAACEIKESVNV